MKPLVLIYARMPRFGRVKTRLARDIGKGRALRFYRTHLTSLARRLSADERWETRVAFASERDVAEGMFPDLGQHIFEVQTAGDLGERMTSSLMRNRPTLVVGSDIPDVLPHHIKRAFSALGQNDAVFGPAPDGGYWLIGLKNLHPQPRNFLKNVRWSSPHTLGDTVATLPKGWSSAYINVLHDIDDGAAFHAWRARLKEKKTKTKERL